MHLDSILVAHASQYDEDTPLTRIISILKEYRTIIIQSQKEIKEILTRAHILDSIMTNNEELRALDMHILIGFSSVKFFGY